MAEATAEQIGELAAELLKELCCEEFEKLLPKVHDQHVSLVFLEVRESQLCSFCYATTLGRAGAVEAWEVLLMSWQHSFRRRDLPANGLWMPDHDQLRDLAENIKTPLHVGALLLVGEGGHTVFAATVEREAVLGFQETDLIPKLREDARG